MAPAALRTTAVASAYNGGTGSTVTTTTDGTPKATDVAVAIVVATGTTAALPTVSSGWTTRASTQAGEYGPATVIATRTLTADGAISVTGTAPSGRDTGVQAAIAVVSGATESGLVAQFELGRAYRRLAADTPSGATAVAAPSASLPADALALTFHASYYASGTPSWSSLPTGRATWDAAPVADGAIVGLATYPAATSDGSTGTRMATLAAARNSIAATIVVPGSPARARAVGQPAEADTARPLTRTRRRSTAQASELEVASPVVRVRRRSIGQAVELELAEPVSARRPGEARQAAELDQASPIARVRRFELDVADETDAPRPLGRVRSRSAATALEGDTSSALVRLRRRDVAAADPETDVASPLGRVHVRTPAQALEGDVAVPLGRRKRRRTIGQALDTSSATGLRRGHRRSIDVGIEFDVALQLGQSTTKVTDAEYAAALVARQRRPYATLRVDWTGAGALPTSPADLGHLDAVVSSIEVERALDGDLPEGAGEVDGFASARLTAELGGRLRRDPDGPVVNAAARRLAGQLSPFRSDSPLAGKRRTTRTIAAELGVVTPSGPRAERVFTGMVRDLDFDDDAATVKIEAVDPSERMRSLVTLPTYGEFVTHVAERGQGNPARGWQFTVNTQWIIDHCSRRDGIFASPPFRAESIIGCTGHGGLVSEVGFNGAPISRARDAGRPKSIHTEDGNPWGMLASPEGSEGSYQEFYGYTDGSKPPLGFYAGQGGGVSGWLHLSSLVGGTAEKVLWQLWPTRTREPRLFVHGFGDGTIIAGLYDQNAYKIATPRIPLGSTPWNFVGVHFRWTDDSTLAVVVRTRAWGSVAGTTRTYSLTGAKVTVTPTPFYDGYRPILQLRAYMWRAWQLLQFWPGFTPPSTASATPWRGEDWTSQADIGRGNNELAYLPDVAAQRSWDIRKAAVEAEYGVHGFGDFGRYYFRARTDTRADRVDHVLDVATNLASVGYSISSDTIRNSVGVTTKPAYHTGVLETVIKADSPDQFIVPGNATRIFELDWPHGAAGWQGGTLPYHYQEGAATAQRDAGNGFPKWSGDVKHGWTYASRGASGGWTILDNTRSVVVDYVQVSARRVFIRVQNLGSGEIRLATAATIENPDSGEPALRIGGWPLASAVDKVSTYRNEESIAELGGDQGGGERALPLPSSEWRQYEPALRPIAEALLAALADEVATLDDLPVRGNPTIRVGNVAACYFRDATEPVIGTVVKTRHRHAVADGKLSTSVTVRPLPVARQPVIVEGADLAPPGWLFYVDISRYQEGIDLGRVQTTGYAGCVAKVGQGASSSQGYAASIDPQWSTFRDLGRVLWPDTFAAYWYVGDGESAADQASRCKAALGDLAIPVMLDWEAGGGSWANLLAVLSAFRSAGIRTTMLYTNLQGYAPSNGATNIDSATGGLALVNSRYWINRATNPAQDPRAVFDDMQANRPGFGFGTVLGGTVDALQFTDAGVVYPGGPAIDVNAFPGNAAQLAAMFGGT